MWHLLVTDLEAISEDTSFDFTTRAKAILLSDNFKGKHFLLIKNFIIDVLEHLEFWSLRMQERTALLIEFTDFTDKMNKTFEDLKTIEGGSTIAFYKNTTCMNPASDIQNINEYENCKTVFYNGIELLSDEDDVPKLSSIKNMFLDELIYEIASYFPQSKVKDFSIFIPKNLPQSDEIHLTLSYGARQILLICDFFKWGNCDTLLKDWSHLLLNIITDENYCVLRSGSPLTFWSTVLITPTITWTQRTKQLIETILVLPVGSADVERGFSIFNHIKSKRRKSLTSHSMDAIMKIRLNGPKNIERFNAMKYAKVWVNENHLKTDDPKDVKGKKSTILDMDEKDKNGNPKYSPESAWF